MGQATAGVRSYRDETNLRAAVTNADTASSKALAAADVIKQENQKEKSAERNPEVAAAFLDEANNALKNAQAALNAVDPSSNIIVFLSEEDTTGVKRADVAALVAAAEKKVKEAQIAKDDVYLSQVLDYAGEAGEVNDVYDIIRKLNTDDQAAVSAAKATCEAKLAASQTAVENAKNAIKNVSDVSKTLQKYKDAVLCIQIADNENKSVAQKMIKTFGTDDEKIDEANKLLDEADRLVNDAKTETDKGADANPSVISDLLDKAEEAKDSAADILNSVSKEGKNQENYKTADQKVTDTQKNIDTQGKQAYDTVPFATDGTTNYVFKDIDVSPVRYTGEKAKNYIAIMSKSSDGKNVDFTNAVVFDVTLKNKSGTTLTLLPNRSINVDLDMTDFTQEQLKNAKLFHVVGDSAVGVSSRVVVDSNKKCWIRFTGTSFSPYGVGDIAPASTSAATSAAVTSSAPSTGQKNPNTGDFSALPIVLICVVALGGIGGVLAYRKKKAAEEEE